MGPLTIVKLPAQATIAKPGESVERDILEKGRESSLECNPDGIVRADWRKHQRWTNLRSPPVVEREAACLEIKPGDRNGSQH